MEKITAKEAKEQADNINIIGVSHQLEFIYKLIKEASARGEYNVTYTKSIYKEANDILKESGFIIESGGRMNEVEHVISWKQIEPEKVEIKKIPLKFYTDGVIGKGLISEEQYRDYVNSLIERFENVSWGGEGTFSTDFTDVVVVLERGVRGPSDWFYLNKDHKWAHGGYTAYKETYTNSEFLIYIAKILEHNKKYEKAIQENEK